MNEYTYEEIITPLGNKMIQRLEDNAFIPCDESNSDYQAYLNKDNPDWGKGTIS